MDAVSSTPSNASVFLNMFREKSYIIIEGSANATTNGSYIISNIANHTHTSNSSTVAKITLRLDGSNASAITLKENTRQNTSLLIGINEFVFNQAGPISSTQLTSSTDIDYHFGKNAEYLGFSKWSTSGNNPYKLSHTLHYPTSFYRIQGASQWTPSYSNIGIRNSQIPNDYTFKTSSDALVEPPETKKYVIELGTPTSNSGGQMTDAKGFISSIKNLDRA